MGNVFLFFPYGGNNSLLDSPFMGVGSLNVSLCVRGAPSGCGGQRRARDSPKQRADRYAPVGGRAVMRCGPGRCWQ